MGLQDYLPTGQYVAPLRVLRREATTKDHGIENWYPELHLPRLVSQDTESWLMISAIDTKPYRAMVQGGSLRTEPREKEKNLCSKTSLSEERLAVASRVETPFVGVERVLCSGELDCSNNTVLVSHSQLGSHCN